MAPLRAHRQAKPRRGGPGFDFSLRFIVRPCTLEARAYRGSRT